MRRLAFLVLGCGFVLGAGGAAAGPVRLDAAALDRVTAGSPLPQAVVALADSAVRLADGLGRVIVRMPWLPASDVFLKIGDIRGETQG